MKTLLVLFSLQFRRRKAGLLRLVFGDPPAEMGAQQG